jgi:hypothetical protein
VSDAKKRGEIVTQHGLISEYALVSASQLKASGITLLPKPAALRWANDGTTTQWDTVPGATGYFVSFWEDGKRIATSDWITGTSYNFASQMKEGVYHFTVKARDAHGESLVSYSDEVKTRASGARMIEVDTKHPAFANSTMRVEGVYGIQHSFTTGRPTGDAVRANTGAGYGQTDIVGMVSSDEFGAATSEAIYPFKGTHFVNDFTIRTDRWDDANAKQEVDYIRIYVSTDGTKWTEASVSEGAPRTNLANANSYAQVIDPTNTSRSNVTNSLNGKSVNIPVWKLANGESLVVLDKPYEAKYVKLAFYGRSNARDYTRIANSFVPFNSISFWSAARTNH